MHQNDDKVAQVRRRFVQKRGRVSDMATRNYEMCNVTKASQCEHQVTFKLDLAHSVVACRARNPRFFDAPFWSENGV
jgi:hypothetical protein